MKTDELFLMLDKFTADTGKYPNKIICGEEAFEKLRKEANDDWGAERYLEPNYDVNGYVAKFAGVPIQVIHNTNALEADKIYMLNEPDDDVFKPIRMTQWWERRPNGDLVIDDIVDEVARTPNGMGYEIRHDDGFMAHYYGKWLYSNTVSENARYGKTTTPVDEEIDISDADLMAVLNGGGFNAVA